MRIRISEWEMLKIKVPREKAEGSYPPRRFYALAWIEYDRDFYVYYPIVINKIVGGMRKIWFWFHRRTRPCKYDEELRYMYWRGREYGEKHGYDQGIDWSLHMMLLVCGECVHRKNLPFLIRKIEKFSP